MIFNKSAILGGGALYLAASYAAYSYIKTGSQAPGSVDAATDGDGDGCAFDRLAAVYDTKINQVSTVAPMNYLKSSTCSAIARLVTAQCHDCGRCTNDKCREANVTGTTIYGHVLMRCRRKPSWATVGCAGGCCGKRRSGSRSRLACHALCSFIHQLSMYLVTECCDIVSLTRDLSLLQHVAFFVPILSKPSCNGASHLNQPVVPRRATCLRYRLAPAATCRTTATTT